MAKVISTLSDCISYVNTLYESDSVAPTAGDEDYTVWTGLINVAINLWEGEEGMLWKELFVKLSSATTGDKTTVAGQTSYSAPSDFRFPASGYVWLGTGTTKESYKVIKAEEAQLYENSGDMWCYFLMGTTKTLEFNPNLDIEGGMTISYNYYKFATKLTTGTNVLEMSDPMFAVYYTLAELKKEEGDTTALSIVSQKLDAMKTLNIMPAYFQDDSLLDKVSDGFGV